MDKRIFTNLVKLFDAETIEILGDAQFAVEILEITERIDWKWEWWPTWSRSGQVVALAQAEQP